MKKNKMMRAAGVLLIAVLLTTSLISGTFAKYVTSGEDSDSARVAKFGVLVTADGSLFSENYYSASEGDNANAPATDGATISVHSLDSTNVVAPGTKSDENGLNLSVAGTPEVKVRVSASITADSEIFLAAGTYQDMTGTQATGSFDLGGSYAPITWTLKNKTTGSVLVSGTIDAINTYLAANPQDFDAGTNLANAFGGYALSWEWGYSVNDMADTVLGDLAANGPIPQKYVEEEWTDIEPSDYSLNVDVTVTITVTQVD